MENYNYGRLHKLAEVIISNSDETYDEWYEEKICTIFELNWKQYLVFDYKFVKWYKIIKSDNIIQLLTYSEMDKIKEFINLFYYNKIDKQVIESLINQYLQNINSN